MYTQLGSVPTRISAFSRILVFGAIFYTLYLLNDVTQKIVKESATKPPQAECLCTRKMGDHDVSDYFQSEWLNQ